MFNVSAISAKHAEQAVAQDHEQRHQHQTARWRNSVPALTESAPSSAPTVRSSMTFSGAGNAPARSRIGQIVGGLGGEVAGDLARAAQDRLVDHRRGDDLLSSTMAKRWPDILLGDVAELARAHAVEAEIHHRLAGRWSKPARGIGQTVAGHHARGLHHDRLRRGCPGCRSCCGSISSPMGTMPVAACGCRRVRPPAGRSSWRSCPGFPSSRSGSCRPGTWTRMRSSPWCWIVGSRVPSFVDAAAHHFDGLVQDLLLGLGLVGVGHLHDSATPSPGSVMSYWPARRRQEESADAGIEIVDQLLGLVIARQIADRDRDAVALGDRSV